MEIAGLAVGGVSLVGVFNSCVQCFDYIQLGRQFGKSFQRGQLKLDTLRLRLCRWAAAVEASGVSGTLEEGRNAEEWLGEIHHILLDAEQISKRFKPQRGNDLQALQLENDGDEDGGDGILALRQKMRQLSLKRQKWSSLGQKASWALHDQKNFNRLLEDLTPLVTSLVELFPALSEPMRTLAAEEAKEMQDEPLLHVLGDSAKQLDDMLQQAVDRVLKGHAGQKWKHEFNKNILEDSAVARYRDEIKDGSAAAAAKAGNGVGSSYSENTAKGAGVVAHYGDSYGDASIFDAARR